MIHWQLVTLAYFSLLFGLATRSRFLRIFLCLPLSLSLFARVAFVDSLIPPGVIDRLNVIVLSFTGFLRTLDLLCSGDPHVAFFRLADKNNGIVNIAEQPFWTRIKWASSLLFSQRGGGWNWRVPGTPPSPPSTTTSSFLLHTFVRWSANCLALEVLTLAFAYLGLERSLWGPLVLIHGGMMYAAMQSTYLVAFMAWVLLGFGGPEECPPIFGSWRDTRTLKGFWGKAWHQLFRRILTVMPNRALALLGMGPDRTGIGAFVLSGVIHAIQMYVTTLGGIVPSINAFLFFAIQPLGFWIEDRVLGLHPRVKNKTAQHDVEPKRTSAPMLCLPPWLGFVWVMTWLSVTARIYFKEVVASGIYGTNGWIAVPVLTLFVTVPVISA